MFAGRQTKRLPGRNPIAFHRDGSDGSQQRVMSGVKTIEIAEKNDGTAQIRRNARGNAHDAQSRTLRRASWLTRKTDIDHALNITLANPLLQLSD